MQSNLTIYHKLYQMTKEIYKITHNMKREYKYGIGCEILALCWECLDLFLEANHAPNAEKSAKIERLSLAFDKLKLRIRMLAEIKGISVGQFSMLCEQYVLPTGQMIGGWKKWSEVG